MDYHVANIDDIITPALIFYPDVIKKNTERVISICGNASLLWPHVKTHKCSEVIKMQMHMGINKFKCATLSELEMVCREGADAALYAIEPAGPIPKRILDLQKRYPDTSLYAIVDCQEHAQMYADAVRQSGSSPMKLFLDINLGLNRTGTPLTEAEDLYASIYSDQNIALQGLHFYDGNRHEADPMIRQAKVDLSDHELLDLRHRLQERGFHVDNLIMGCSPSFPCHVKNYETGMFFSPGTLFLNDASYYNDFKDLDMEPAATIATRVLSHPGEGLFTLDCGYKGISGDPPSPFRGQLWNAGHCVPILQNEEHWVFRMEEGYENERPAINSIIYVIPMHICPCSVLYPWALVAENGLITKRWTITARDRMIIS